MIIKDPTQNDPQISRRGNEALSNAKQSATVFAPEARDIYSSQSVGTWSSPFMGGIIFRS
jgi:hypothetical protein